MELKHKKDELVKTVTARLLYTIKSKLWEVNSSLPLCAAKSAHFGQ